MKTWKLTIEYDGTRYSGWQEQQNAKTVVGEIRKAAEDFFGTRIDLCGAGRTDAGVHALAQVAHLKVEPRRARIKSLPRPMELLYALNDRLPADINVLAVAEADPPPAQFVVSVACAPTTVSITPNFSAWRCNCLIVILTFLLSTAGLALV